MWKEVLETYRAIVTFQTVEKTAEQLKREQAFLEQMAKDSGYIEDETGLRGQYGGHRE